MPERFGSIELLAYRRRTRVSAATKRVTAQEFPEPAWFWEPGLAPGTWREFDLTRRRATGFHLRTLPGIFAYDRLDEGTALLLEHLQVPEQCSVLDVGCGYGIIGLVAKRLGAAQVDMVDVNCWQCPPHEKTSSATMSKEPERFPATFLAPSMIRSTI